MRVQRSLKGSRIPCNAATFVSIVSRNGECDIVYNASEKVVAQWRVETPLGAPTSKTRCFFTAWVQNDNSLERRPSCGLTQI